MSEDKPLPYRYLDQLTVARAAAQQASAERWLCFFVCNGNLHVQDGGFRADHHSGWSCDGQSWRKATEFEVALWEALTGLKGDVERL